VPCYFRKKKCECDVADIEGFMDIKFDDQKLIKELISGTTKVVVPVKTKGKGKAGGGRAAGGGAKSEYEVGDYAVEVAKSGRAKCRECEQPIAAGALRCRLVEQMDFPLFLPSPKWHHLKCVDVSSTGVRDVKDITGFDLLSKDDQDIMRAKFSGAGSKKRPNDKYVKTAIPKALLKQGRHFHMHDILTYLYIYYILNISPPICLHTRQDRRSQSTSETK